MGKGDLDQSLAFVIAIVAVVAVLIVALTATERWMNRPDPSPHARWRVSTRGQPRPDQGRAPGHE